MGAQQERISGPIAVESLRWDKDAHRGLRFFSSGVYGCNWRVRESAEKDGFFPPTREAFLLLRLPRSCLR